MSEVRLEFAELTSSPDRQWYRAAEWCDEDGVVLAVGMKCEAGFRLDLHGVAAFEWSLNAGPVSVHPHAGTDPQSLGDAFSRSVLPLVLHTRGLQVLHASAVLGSQGLCVLCARSGTGKSTLAYALSQQAEFTLWADDAVAFQVGTASVSSQPLPFSLRLRPNSAAYFDRANRLLLPGPTAHEPENVAAVVVLERARGDSTAVIDVQRLKDVDAFTALLEHAYCFDFESDRMRATSQAYLELAARVPVYSLRFIGRLDLIPDIVDELTQLV